MHKLKCSWRSSVLVSILCILGVSSSAFGLQLTLWEQEKDEIQKVLDDLITKFEKEHKGVKIKRSHFRTEDLRTQYQTAAIGGGGADIVIAPSDFAGPLAVMRIIQPVGTVIKEAKVDLVDDALETVKDSEGKVWGYPVSRGNHLMLYYNKNLVKKAPETLEELVDSAKKITDKKVYGFAYNLNEPFWFVTFLGAYGDRPLVDGKPNLGGKGMVEALAFTKDLKFKDKVVPSDCDYACADTLFVENKAGMIINGDWALGRYQDALKDNLGIAPLPKSKAGGSYMQPMVSGNFVFFNSKLKGKDFEAAKSFAKFLTQTDSQEYFAKKGGRLPVTKSAEKSSVIAEDPALKASQQAMEHGQPMPMDVQLRAVWDAIRPQLQGVMAGRTEPKVAAANMQKDAERRIKEMGQ